ncbi:glycosyltransferase [Pseudonocardia halophobica]|uniref:glycosyltransferase n=1 Tax=Pseudonocardia halophobica TaxID=29401 RepID=UPI0018CC527E|nr:glycosyltransferase [Pseudonocardia halophobica]
MLYLAVHDITYPRNRRIRSYLSENYGIDSESTELEQHGGYLRRSVRMLIAGLRRSNNIGAVVLAEFNVQYWWIGYIIGRFRRVPVITDRFVGLYETNVEDWQRFSSRSIKARAHGLFDTLAVRFADYVLIDTEVRAMELRSQTSRARVFSLPVGAPDWAVPRPRARSASDPLKILYYGNYIPLHGLSTVMAAAETLARTGKTFALTMVGDGELRGEIESAFRRGTASEHVSFLDPVPEHQLSEIISEHDVVLGIFGDSRKAASVIANKVWQGLACGRTVITRNSHALGEIASLTEGQLVQIEASNSDELASALAMIEPVPDDGEASASHIRLREYVDSRYAMFAAALMQRLEGALDEP